VEYRKSNYLWSRTCEEAFRLEDWIAWTNQVTWKQRIAIFHKNAWHTFYFPCGYRFCALIALLFSILVVWSETTIWSFKTFHGYVDLSPLSLWIHRQGMSNYSIQVSIIISLFLLDDCSSLLVDIVDDDCLSRLVRLFFSLSFQLVSFLRTLSSTHRFLFLISQCLVMLSFHSTFVL